MFKQTYSYTLKGSFRNILCNIGKDRHLPDALFMAIILLILLQKERKEKLQAYVLTHVKILQKI
jgi:hypothetical protein